MMTFKSRLLERQIKKYIVDVEGVPESFVKFVNAVDTSYENFDRDTALLHQSLSVMSDELNSRNDVLQKEKTEQTILIKKLEEAHNQLLQSEKMASIGQLAAGVAHEINNPIGYVSSNLSSLNGYVKSVLAMLLEYETHTQYLPTDSICQVQRRSKELDIEYIREDIVGLFEESKEGIDKVKKIIQDLKDFSRVDNSGEWEFSDLHKGIDSALNIAANEIRYKASIVKEYGEIPFVFCLLSQLNQVFLNLLVNAAQAMSAGGRGVIRIKTSVATEHRVLIEVSDNGCGISEEIVNKIFDPFFTTKPVGVGTGLGLSISYGIIHKHKGSISVESKLGIGTSFKVYLPIAEDQEKI